MVYVLTQTDPLPVEPYLTSAEYRQAPTGVDVSGLVKGDQAASLAELANVIARASSWADTMCGQVLAATPDVEGGRLSVTRDGILRIHPRQNPVVDVTGIAYGSTPAQMTPLTDLSNVWVEPASIIVPLTQIGTAFYGSLGFTSVVPGTDVYVQWSYIAGWPNTTLTGAVTAGDTTLTIKTPTGILPGTGLTIYDGAQTETVTVASTYTPMTSPVTLTSGALWSHPVLGTSVSALPPAVKEAVILLTSALIKTRGSSAMVLQSVRGELSRADSKGESGEIEEIDLADELLAPYRRLR